MYEQRIEHCCAEYNLTILEEKQWEEPPNLKIQLLYEQRVERRCAEYNLTILEEKQWEPSNLKIGDDDDSGEESEEHDSDVVYIYTSSDDDDDDDDEDNLIKEPVLFESLYKGFREGDSYDSYDPADLSDVSMPSDKEGKDKFLSECTLQAYNNRTNRNREYSLGLEWPQYEKFGQKVMLDERIRKMNCDWIEQLRSRAYKAALSPEKKADFWNVHSNWWQLLSEDEKQAEKNKQDTQGEISKRHKKS